MIGESSVHLQSLWALWPRFTARLWSEARGRDRAPGPSDEDAIRQVIHRRVWPWLYHTTGIHPV
jgi:hypothetical protein